MQKQNRIGKIQLALVIIFIISVFVISKMLEIDDSGNSQLSFEERTLKARVKHFYPSNYQIKFNASGQIIAKAVVDIIPQVSGRVDWISDNAFSGGKFESNESLFSIEKDDYNLQLIARQAELSSAYKNLQLELAENKIAEDEADELIKYLNKDDSSSRKVTSSELTLRHPHLAEAKARHKAAEENVQHALIDLKRTVYSLPFAGSIINSNINKGQYIRAGASYGRAYDHKSLEVLVELSQNQLSSLNSDPHLVHKMKFSHLGEQLTYDVRLNRSFCEIDQKSRFAKIYFDIEKIDNKLIPGLFTEVEIKGRSFNQVHVVDAKAVQNDGMILLVDGSNKIIRFKPHIQYKNNEIVVISNLPKKPLVIIEHMPGAIDGMTVETYQSKES